MTDRNTTSIVTAMIAANDSPEFRAGIHAAWKFFSAMNMAIIHPPGDGRDESVAIAAHYFSKVPALWLAHLGEKQ